MYIDSVKCTFVFYSANVWSCYLSCTFHTVSNSHLFTAWLLHRRYLLHFWIEYITILAMKRQICF